MPDHGPTALGKVAPAALDAWRLAALRMGVPLLAAIALVLAAWTAAGSPRAEFLFGVVLPYGSLALFLCGITWRVLYWARAPVPFAITTTCGQQLSLPWIRSSPLENPHTRWGVAGRVLLEMLFFRSLLRNVRHEWVADEGAPPRLVFRASLGLWVGAIVFHYSLLLVLLHHARFFLDPVFGWIEGISRLDSFFRVGSAAFFLSGIALTAGALYLLGRRVTDPWMRHLSLPSDYFPLYLLLGIALTGGMMHYSTRTDVPAVKAFCLGLAALHPVTLAGVGPLFHVHLALACVLLAYIPFSKLVHMVALPLSPTRNLPGAGRMIRHRNPWNHPVPVHTYGEYEDEYRDKMKAAGIPVERQAP